MKLGLGLYKHMLTPENFAFARQCGATHLVIHLVDYFAGSHENENPRDNQPTGARNGWGRAGNPEKLWTYEEIIQIKQQIETAGLACEAIENFDPAHWYDILLDGPEKARQMEQIKQLIRDVGRAGIPIFGYNFSIAGVCGRLTGPFARGGAISVGMDEPDDTPVPLGMIWNMIYDSDAPVGNLPEINPEQLWHRYAAFINEILPVAEAAGVRLALHPDDPPMPTMRRQPRLVYQPHLYDKVLSINPGPHNQFELCLGTIAEMTEGNVYDVVEKYSRDNRIAYIHVRNVHGKVPHYRETFIDDGDIDMARVIKILRKNKFEGVLIPDHTPQMSCDAPWHAGMAHALGYLKGLLTATV